jgi:hypothetical protein
LVLVSHFQDTFCLLAFLRLMRIGRHA